MKKVSQAALDGLAMVKGDGQRRMYSPQTDCACVEGCIAFGYGVSKEELAKYLTYNPLEGAPRRALMKANAAFEEETGVAMMTANDGIDSEGFMRVEDIAGILRAVGH